ncbi:MAG TPA: lactonase family protein [Pilimelia sp.]|nr:lactonase family protein [Pilimelia sp.]
MSGLGVAGLGPEAQIGYVGCYTAEAGGSGEGIGAVRRDPDTGRLTWLGVAAPTDSPSFLARHPSRPVLYAVHEGRRGAVSAWSLAPDGGLSRLVRHDTGGDSPCHLAVSPDGRWLLCANYGSGSVAAYPLDEAGVPGQRSDLAVHDGRGPDPDRQAGPHAHMVAPGADARVWAVDLGTDGIHRYALADGRLRPAGPPVAAPPGTGPRHLAFGPGDRWYVTGELAGTVLCYAPDPATGEPTLVAQAPASRHAGPVHPSELAVHPAGGLLYVANRGPDTVAVFTLAGAGPRLVAEVPCGGRWPRHLALWGDFLHVANERSHSLVTMALDPVSGVPAPAGEPLEVPSPTCVCPPPAAGRRG